MRITAFFLLCFCVVGHFAIAQQQTINVGSAANDGTGDTLRSAFQKTNANFTDLYTNKQTVDSDLTTIAALSASNDDILQRKSGAWTNRTLAQVAADLQTPLGSIYQGIDTDLTAVAGLTASNDDFLQRKSGAWANRTVAQVATDLQTPLNSVYQSLDSDLTAVAGLTASNDDVLQRKSGAWTNRTVAQLATDLQTPLDARYALIGGGGGSLPSTNGDINIVTDADLLIVDSATGFAQYQIISIAGAGQSGAALVTWIESISGTSIDLYNSATASVTDAAVTVLVGDTPASVASKLGSVTTDVNVGDALSTDATNGGIKVGHDQATETRVLYAKTTGMHFPIEQFAGVSFTNDNSWSLQLNRNGVSATHPIFGMNIENYYNTGSQNLVEHNWDYTSVDRATVYRPYAFAIDIATHEAEHDIKAKRWVLRNRNAGSGGRPEYQIDINTDTNLTSVYGRFRVNTTGLTANAALFRIDGDPGTANMVELVQSGGAMIEGASAIYVNPTATTAAYVHSHKHVQSAPRLLSVQQNSKTDGTSEAYLMANAADAFQVYQSTGATWSAGIDYSDSQSFTIGPAAEPGTDNAIRIAKATGATTVKGDVKAPSFTLDAESDTLISAISSGAQIKKHNNTTDAILRCIANNESIGTELTYEGLRVYTPTDPADLKLLSKGAGSYVYLGTTAAQGLRFCATDPNTLYNSVNNTDVGIATAGTGNVVIRPNTNATATFSASQCQFDKPVYTAGGIKRYRQAKTAAYTLLATDDVIDCTSGTFTLTLTAAAGVEGRVFTIVNTGAGVITLDGDGSETINGSATRTLNQWDSVDIMSTGSGWIVI